MRTLVIAGEYPWPVDSGPRTRLTTTLRGLRRCGPVELVSVVSRFRSDFDPPDASMGLDKVARVGFDNRPPSGRGLVSTLARPAMPLALPWQDRSTVQRALARFASGHYDLVWYFGARPWVLSGEAVTAPTILDLDDLEDQKIVARLAAPRPPAAGWPDRARRSGSALVAGEEIRRWRRLERRAGYRVSSVVVCSELDARRARASGVVGVDVVPNGYRTPERPVGRTEVSRPATVLFQGLLRYPPNIAAARLLAGTLGPALAQRVPGVEIRLVGDHPPELSALHDPPAVTVVGRVPDITTELARADLVVVPLRYGSGTRVKILEAFAHRVPVVSTTLGAEGLGVEDGEHLLIGDTDEELVAACTRLLTDTGLRKGLADRAQALYAERFAGPVVEAGIETLARRVAGSGRADRPPSH
jgi:glycosyltransferase involved in cell wall biosynthesis